MMRVIAYLSIAAGAMLPLITALFCGWECVALRVQRIETQAELVQSRESGKPISAESIDLHLSRIDRQIQHWKIVACLTGAMALGGIIGWASVPLLRREPADNTALQ